MSEKRTSLWENGLIWFGAGVSIAEILTGTYLAPLGFRERTYGNYSWSSYRLPYAVLCRYHRRKSKKKCHGNC